MICIASSSSYNNKRERERELQREREQQHYKLFDEYTANDDINLNRLAQEYNNVLLPLLQKSINKLAIHFTKKGMLQELIYVLSQGATILKSNLAVVAVRHGQLRCLRYLASLGVSLTSTSTSTSNLTVIAAKHGQLRCLRYLASLGVTFDADVTKVAATTGNLECLQFAIKSGCPYDLEMLLKVGYEKYIKKQSYDLFLVVLPLCDTFVRAQIEYMLSLPVGDFLAICLYVGNPLFRAINTAQQGLLQVELLPQNLDWKKVAEIYYSLNNMKFPEGDDDDVFVVFIHTLFAHIQKLINKAPTTDKPLTVYRGVKTPYFLYDFQDNLNRTFLHKGFISTSLKRDVAMYFSREKREEEENEEENDSGGCTGGENEGGEQEEKGYTGGETKGKNQYMLTGTLQVGTKCLFYPLESEILLSSNTQIKLLKQLESLDHEAEYQVEFL